MEEVKTEVKEERTPISAEVLEEVLLRFLGSYLIINELLQLISIFALDDFVGCFHSRSLMFSLAARFAIGIFLIVAAGKWIKLTRFFRKFF